MKYMGSKRWMLRNGLADLIHSRISQHKRFVDLFSGSAAVSWHVASKHAVPVLANDLQEFCRVLAGSIVCRTVALDHNWIEKWGGKATSCAENHQMFVRASNFERYTKQMTIMEFTDAARALCANAGTPATSAYGGYYFSPLQAIYFDSLRSSLPSRRPYRLAALAALVQAASDCAASPGHTAQPFRATLSAEPFLRRAWSQNVLGRVRSYAELLSNTVSNIEGTAAKGDANKIAHDLTDSDLVFIDPPYSSVQYSRFYHVLETIADGYNVQVSGSGRYPPRELRHQSRYSLSSESARALHDLLETIGKRQAGVIVTFPAGAASNGLTGKQVIDMARNWFTVNSVKVKSRFSTLGGNNGNRSARIRAEEYLLSLDPK